MWFLLYSSSLVLAEPSSTCFLPNTLATADCSNTICLKQNISCRGTKIKDLSNHCVHIFCENNHIRNATILLTICLISLTIALICTSKLKQEVDETNYNYTENNYGDHLGKHKVFYRHDWGGSLPKINTKPLEHPVGLVIISHTSTFTCNSTESCSSTVRDVQAKHFAEPICSVDIGYNFLIGGDENIYVGRGWDVRNFHRKISIGISFIGNFNYDEVTTEMLDTAKELITQGVELEKIAEDYVLVGENQTNSKMLYSPGMNVYKIIKDWPHFYNKTMF